MLYCNGESLLQKPLKERREKLNACFKEVEGKFTFAKTMESDDVEDIGVSLRPSKARRRERSHGEDA